MPREVEKNLRRLVSDWSDAAASAIHELRGQALRWVRSELATLGLLLERQADEVPALEESLRRLAPGLSSIGGAYPAD